MVTFGATIGKIGLRLILTSGRTGRYTQCRYVINVSFSTLANEQ